MPWMAEHLADSEATMLNLNAHPEEDLWAVWPDGDICPIEDLEERLTWKADDYAVVRWGVTAEELEDPLYDGP